MLERQIMRENSLNGKGTLLKGLEMGFNMGANTREGYWAEQQSHSFAWCCLEAVILSLNQMHLTWPQPSYKKK